MPSLVPVFGLLNAIESPCNFAIISAVVVIGVVDCVGVVPITSAVIALLFAATFAKGFVIPPVKNNKADN